MARYTISALNDDGDVTFDQKLTIQRALDKARELQKAGFHRIRLVNVETAVEISDLEHLLRT